jgi:hypothetical protein
MTDKVPQDTHPEIEALLIEGFRVMTPSEKMRIVSQLTLAVQQLALADVRRRRPNADARELELRVASRWIEPELMLAAFGWDVEKMGY